MKKKHLKWRAVLILALYEIFLLSEIVHVIFDSV